MSSKYLSAFDFYPKNIHHSQGNLAIRKVIPSESEDPRIRWQREEELINSQFTTDGFYIGGSGGLARLQMEKAKIRRQTTMDNLFMFSIFLMAVLGVVNSFSKQPEKPNENELPLSVNKE